MADDDIFSHLPAAGRQGAAPAGDIFGHIGPEAKGEPDYTGWDTAQPTSKLPPLPLAKEPGKTYGTILPFAKDDKTGALEWAVPEVIRSPIRGVVAGGEEAMGVRPANDPSVRGDITAAAGLGAGVSPGAIMAKPAAELPRPMLDFVSAIVGGDVSKNKAAMRIVTRLEQDKTGGGVTAQDMIDLLNLTPNKPLSVVDVAGENTLALAGKVARKPGPWRQTLTKWLNERDQGAGPRLDHDITHALGQEGGRDAFDTLVKTRSVNAKPLFEKADAGGSIAPLETQFRNAFNEASAAEKQAAQAVDVANSQLNAALGKKPVTQGNVYSESAANEAVREAQANVAAARAKLEQAQTGKERVLDMLRQAQEDIATGKPGAVWNPRIQEFLDNPRIKAGIRHGWRIERDEALAEGRAVNATEYAITGETADGEPIVGAVPTMRLLRIAKQGLDRLLSNEKYHDKTTGELNTEGVAIDKVRAEFRNELDKVNPDYKAARAQWSGDSESLKAFRLGERLFKENPREIEKLVAEMTPNDKEFLRLGAARLLRDEVAKKGITGDEAKAIIRSQYTRNQIRPLFDSDAQFERFINGVEAEGRMFGSRYSILGNSKTAAREMEDASPELDALGHAAKGVKSASHGNIFGAIGHAWDTVRTLSGMRDPAINTELARILSADLSKPETMARLHELEAALARPRPPRVPPAEYQLPSARLMAPAETSLYGAMTGMSAPGPSGSQ